MGLRLSPIERPKNPILRLAYRMSKRQFGKVLTTIKVIYARKVRLLPSAMQMQRTMENGLSIDPALRLLIQVQTSRLNGCVFCEDLALAGAVRHSIGVERFAAMADYRTSPLFTERERAALAFTEAAVRDRTVSDETAAWVRKYYSESEIVELTWIAAAESFFNIQAHALGIASDDLVEIAVASRNAARLARSAGRSR